MLWRLHIRPAPKNGMTWEDVISYCLEKEVAGMGWPVDEPPKSVEQLSSAVYKQYGSHTAVISFAKDVKIDDLLWARDRAGVYYLGRITGDWYYSDSKVDIGLDIPNQRPCKWQKMGNEQNIPGKIIACFRPQRAFQTIASDKMLSFSEFLYNKLSNKVRIKEDTENRLINSEKDFFELIDSNDCEDIVGLYLQVEKGFLLIPSTCKIATIGTEYYLKDPQNGKTIAVQVKQGEVNLDQRLLGTADEIYLFTTNGVVTENHEKIRILSAKEMYDFVLNNLNVMPDRIKYWLEYDKIEGLAVDESF